MIYYQQWSDFEINKAVAESQGFDWSYINYDPSLEDEPPIKINSYDSNGDYAGFIADYCNNPSDAWPIICEFNLELEWSMAGANFFHGDIESGWNKNPLRAAMICFLMMQE